MADHGVLKLEDLGAATERTVAQAASLEQVATAAEAAREGLRASVTAANEAGSSIQTAFLTAGTSAEGFLATVGTFDRMGPIEDLIGTDAPGRAADNRVQRRDAAGATVRRAVGPAGQSVDAIGVAADGVTTTAGNPLMTAAELPASSSPSMEIKPPDVSQAAALFNGYRQAGEAATAAAAQGFGEVFRTVDTVSSAVQSGSRNLARFGTTADRIRLPDFRRPAADVERLGESALETGRNIASSADAAEAALQGIAGAVARIDAKIPELGANVGEQTLKAAEGFVAAGDGALTLARGIAFITSSTQQQFEETSKTINTVSAAFDVFRGGIQTVKGVSDGLKALQSAARGASVAQTALATANTSVTATAGAARTAMTALNAALGPVGLAVAAIGAAVAGLAAVWKFFSTPAQEPVQQTVSALDDMRSALEGIRERADLRDLRAQFALDAIAFDRPLSAQDRLASIEQKRLATLREINRTGRGFGSGALDLTNPDQRSLNRLQAGAASEDEGEAQRSLAILQLIEEVQQNDLETKRESLKVLQEQNRVLRDNREQTVEELKAARSALDVARQARHEAEQRAQSRRDAFAERIGALNPEQLAQVRRIQAVRDAGGSVSRQDALLLEEFGVTDTFARDVRRRTGIAAGALGFERSFGLNFDEGAVEAEGRVVREEGRVQALEGRIREQLREAGRGVANGDDPLTAFVQELTRQVEQNRHQQRQHLNEIVGTIERLLDHSSLLAQLEDRLQVAEQQRRLNAL